MYLPLWRVLIIHIFGDQFKPQHRQVRLKFWKRIAILFSQGSTINQKVTGGFLCIYTQWKKVERLSILDSRVSAVDTFDGNNVSTFLFPEFDGNFDVSTCNFVQDTNDDFDWTRRKGSTPSSNTAPSSDDASGSGWLRTKFNCYSPGDWVSRSIRYFSSVNFFIPVLKVGYKIRLLVFRFFVISSISNHSQNIIKTDSVQSSSNKWKNFLLEVYPQHGSFLNAI